MSDAPQQNVTECPNCTERDDLLAACRYLLGWVDPDEYCDGHAPSYNTINGKECDNADCEWCTKHRWITKLVGESDG